MVPRINTLVWRQNTFRSQQPFGLGMALSPMLLRAFASSKSSIHCPVSGFAPRPPIRGTLDLPCFANITLTPLWRTGISLLVYAGRSSGRLAPSAAMRGAQKEPPSLSPSDQLPDLRSPVFTTPNTKFLSVVFCPSCLARCGSLVESQRYIATLLQTGPLRCLHGVVNISHGSG